ncbi:MAG: FAD-dependent oxidoreductase [Acidobacteriota bacterium]|nr:FAD-dependent oxidoreductase [Acidobacteriota bacterium]
MSDDARNIDVEVCVIGGGPAGSTCARKLATLGHDVCLIERSRFPRPHVGESLTPGILPLLDALGLRDRIESAPFLRPDRAIVRWSDATDHLKSMPGDPGFQVDRGLFDQLLVEEAREAGVKVLQPATGLRPARLRDRWIVPVRGENGYGPQVRARFVVDASGRRSVQPGVKKRRSAPTLALYGYWRHMSLNGSQTRVEASECEWYWGAPLPDGTFNAAVFLGALRRLPKPTARFRTALFVLDRKIYFVARCSRWRSYKRSYRV